MGKASITLLALLWRFIFWLWSIIIVGLVVGILGNAVFSYSTTGKLYDINPHSFLFLLLSWIYAHPYQFALILALVLIATISSYLADRYQRRTIKAASQRALQPLSTLNRHRMLARVRAVWIDGFLAQSLLGRENPWPLNFDLRLQLVSPLSPDRSLLLPANASILQAYDDATGELLILGEPGSGKTTLLLVLARDLLDRAQKDETYPMPIVFNLSSWAAKQQPLTEWLVEELNTKYQVPYSLGQSWVNTRQVIPLLDGLDEVTLERRSACIHAINTFRGEHFGPIVVCSRTADYLAQPERLTLQSAIIIQPLQQEQISNVLRTQKLAPLYVGLQANHQLSSLVDTPLMLKILMLAYYEKPDEALLTKGSAEVQQRKIFETYVEQMLRRRAGETRYTEQQTNYWLTWLAQQMKRHNLVEFSIEQLQVDWLSTGWQRTLYQILFYLLFGVGSVVIIGPLLARIGGPFLGSILGLLFGLLFGFLFNVRTEREPIGVIKWSWRSEGWRLGSLLLFVLIAGSTISVVFGLLSGLLFGLAVILLLFMLLWLMRKLPNELDTYTYTTPNQGLWRSTRNSIVVGLLFGLLIGAVFGVIVSPVFGVFLGLFSGLFLWLLLGGDASIKHIILRLLLWNAGVIPLRFSHFLDYAAGLLLLRKVGGGYIFTHHLLLEYFAGLDASKAPDTKE